MIRVLFVTHTLDLRAGGAERVLHGILSSLDRSRFETTLCVPEETTGAEFEDLAETIRLPRGEFGQVGERGGAPRVALSLARLTAAFFRVLGRTRPDVVHVNSIFALHFALVPARARGIPVVYHEHNLVHQRVRSLWHRALRPLLRGVTRTVAITDAVRGELIDFGVPPQRVVTVRNGIAPRADDEPPRSPLPRALEGRSFAIGQVANLHAWKGHETVLRAARSVVDAVPKARFVFVGAAHDPAHADHLRALCRELELDDVVEFTGFREDAGALVPRFSCLVVASDAEPFGLVLLEGMRAGVPVVGSASGGVLEIIEDGENGLLFPPGDAPALAGALTRIARDGALREHLVSRGLHTVCERYSLAAQAAGMASVFEDAARRSSR